MHDLPLSNRYRLQRAIKRLPGLVAYYPLNEIEGSAARNYAPATRGALDGVTTGATVGQPGRAGRAYGLDGVNDDIRLGRIDQVFSSVLNSGAYGVGLLLKTTQTANRTLFGYTDGSGTETFVVRANQASAGGNVSGIIGLFIRDSDNVFKNISPTNMPSPVLNNDAWHLCYVQGVPSSNSVDAHTWFIDGLSVPTSLQNTSSVDNWDGPNQNKIGIGAEYNASGVTQNFFAGSIQHLFVVDRLQPDAALLKLAQIAGLAQ